MHHQEQDEEGYSGPPKLTLAVVGVVALIIPILVAAFLVVPGLQPSAGGGGATGTAAVTIDIPAGVGQDQTLNFNPPTVTVVIGVNNSVKWTDSDSIPHTVTYVSSTSNATQPFDSKTLNKGDVYVLTAKQLSAPGTITYDCTFHPGWMKGTIIVKAAGGSGATSTGLATTSTTSSSTTSQTSSK